MPRRAALRFVLFLFLCQWSPQLDHFTSACPCALEVNLDHLIEVFLGHLVGHLVPEDPGVVHEDVDLPPGFDSGPDDGFGGGDGSDRGTLCHRVISEFFGEEGRRAGVDVVDDDPGALGDVRLGDRLPDASCGPGNDRDLALQSPSHGSAS